ncbi:MAG: PLP-dependent aminotransferase family protein [Clostridia bacterium]|nr:PLP-dependent aminotransferase family protein [Clostridia bacterium]
MKKYYNLYNEIKNKILSGQYKAEEKLPSKRVMADRSGYSIITVQKAYEMLEDEGYIIPKERKGYFVCEIDVIKTEKTGSNHIEYLNEPSDFKTPDFEYSVWFKTVRKVISEKGNLLFAKAPGKGCEVLRNAIADYLLRYRGMVAPPQRIIIGSGAEQLYETAVKVLGRDKIYGIEDPCYEQIPSVYNGMGVKICPLKMGNDGIKSEMLSSEFDVLHVTPFQSYPTGVTTSASKRWKYLKWANKKRSYIIEDDFNSEFFIPGHPIDSLYALDTNQSVIYINTFSKSLSPAMRMGYMILPEILMEKYEQVMGNFSCSVPVMDQYILAEFISSGNFERHLNRMRRQMKR